MINVLIVDDECIIGQGLSKIISKFSGYNVIALAENGDEAINFLNKLSIQIVITDIKMPVMDGLSLAKKITEDFPSTKVIISTGYPDFDYALKAIEYKVVDFILKPTSEDKIFAALEKARGDLFENDVPMLKKSLFFYDLIYGNKLSYLFVQNNMSELGINAKNFVVALINSIGNDSTSLIKGLLTEKLNEVYFVDKGENEFYVILCSDEDILKVCEDIIKLSFKNEEFSLNIGISSSFSDPIYFQNAANEAENALKFTFYNDPLIAYKNIPQVSDKIREQAMQHLKLLKACIENKEISSTRFVFNELFDFVYKEKVDFNEIKKICLLIYNFCITTLSNYSILSPIEDDKLIQIETILKTEHNIRESLLKFTEDVVLFISKNPSYIDNIILTVKNYIDLNYKNDISLEMLANKAHFSPSYLSKLFKKQVGDNISTYIQNVRLTKAKELLKTTNMKTYEVAQAVGIDDPVYFSRIFKKSTGVKPKEYKQNHM